MSTHTTLKTSKVESSKSKLGVSDVNQNECKSEAQSPLNVQNKVNRNFNRDAPVIVGDVKTTNEARKLSDTAKSKSKTAERLKQFEQLSTTPPNSSSTVLPKLKKETVVNKPTGASSKDFQKRIEFWNK